MCIEKLLTPIANICIYYYISYNEKILGEKVNIHTNRILNNLIGLIYKGYLSCTNEFNIDEMMIMQFPNEKVINLNTNNIDIVDVFKTIDEWIEDHKLYYTNRSANPNVISLSYHPIENYIPIDHVWIIQTIGSYIWKEYKNKREDK